MRRKRRWPRPGRVDVRGLRAVENQMQRLAAAADTVLDDVVPGWGFLIFAVQFRGAGSSFVTSVRSREALIAKVRFHAQRLAERVPAPGVQIGDVGEAARPWALSQRQVEGLTIAVPAIARLVKDAMPRGWGFALLVFCLRSDQIVYFCDCDRDDIAEALAEFADRLEAGEDRGPGVVGEAH